MERPLVLELELARATDVADPAAFRGGLGVYVVRWQGGAYREARVAWDEALLGDLAALQHERPEPALAARLGARLAGALAGAGWDEAGRNIAEAVRGGRPVILDFRAAAAELFALPWELLPVPALGQPLGALEPVLVRYAWPETQPAELKLPADQEQGRLLFAWSAAGGALPAGAHQGALARAASGVGLRFEPAEDVLPDASLAALQRALQDASAAGRPFTALHLLCHGSPGGGLLLSEEAGGATEVAGDALARALGPHAGTLRFVALCACHSGAETPGRALGSAAQHLHRAGVAAVLGSRLPLSIAGATTLCETLYGPLLSGLVSVQDAVRTTRRALALDGERLDWASLLLYGVADARPVVRRPYRGLMPFLAQHASLFFGRETELAELRGDLRALAQSEKPRFLLVLGASGTGKSSLVMAGLGPALQREGGWEVRRFRPGATPVAALDTALAAAWTGHLLLVADQLEELFTHTDAPGPREELLRRLWTLAGDARSGVSVVATLRVDFLARCDEIVLERGGLRLDRVACDDAHRLLLSQMDHDQMRTVIEGPAQLAGLGLEPGLPERMLEDVEGQPGALPLLQYTLDLLWQRRRGNLLTQAAYSEMGGVAGALSGMAEAVHEGLDEAARTQLRRLMVRLVSAPNGAVADTRQQMSLAAVRPAAPGASQAFAAALDAVCQARLVSVEDGPAPKIELAHEALLRRWERLRTWLREDQQRLGELAEVEEWARQWRQYGSLLETTDQLGFASRIAERYADDLSPDAAALVQQSQARVARRRRIDRAIRLGVGLAAAVFLIMALVEIGQARRMGELREVAEARARDLEIQSQRARDAVRVNVAGNASRDPTRGVVLLREAESPVRSTSWRQTAIDLLHRPVSTRVLRGHRGPITAMDLRSTDGALATASEDGEVRLWRPDTGALLATLVGHGGAALDVACSQAGDRLLTRDRAGKVRIWPGDGQGAPFVLQSSDGPLLRATFRPDGQRVLTVDASGRVALWRWDGAGDPVVLATEATEAIWSPDGAEILTIHADGAARRWATDTGGLRAVSPVTPGGLAGAVYGSDGRVALVGRAQVGAVLLWKDDLWIRLVHDGASAARFSPDGQWLAVASEGPAGVALWSADGEGPSRALVGEHGGATALAWSADSHLLATGHADGAVQIWHTEGGEAAQLIGHRGPVQALRFDGPKLYSAARDGELRSWTLGGGRVTGTLAGLEGGALVAWAPDGASLTVAAQDGQTRRWRLDHPFSPESLPAATALAWNPDGTWTTGDANGQLAQGGARASLAPIDGWVGQLAWSPNGRWLAATSMGGTLRVQGRDGAIGQSWDRTDAGPMNLAWAPDGQQLAVAWSDGAIRLYPVVQTGPERVLRGVDVPATRLLWAGEALISLHADHARRWRADGAGEPEVLDPDGGPPLAMGVGADGTVRVLRATGQLVALGPDGTVAGQGASGPPDLAVFSTDGTRWAAGFPDGHIELGVHDEVYRLRGHRDGVVGLAFSRDGRSLASVAATGAPRVWATDTSDAGLSDALWAATADCGIAADRKEALNLATATAEASLWACVAHIKAGTP